MIVGTDRGAPIPEGATCRIDGGRLARVYSDAPSAHTYHVAAVDRPGWIRGISRDRLEVLAGAELRAAIAGRILELTEQVRAHCWPVTLANNLAQAARRAGSAGRNGRCGAAGFSP